MSLFRPQLWRIPTTGEAERRQLPELTATLETRLKHIARHYPQAVFASSLAVEDMIITCLLYTSPSPRDVEESRMPSSA